MDSGKINAEIDIRDGNNDMQLDMQRGLSIRYVPFRVNYGDQFRIFCY